MGRFVRSAVTAKGSIEHRSSKRSGKLCLVTLVERVPGIPEAPLASGLTPSTWWTLIRDASKLSADPAM
jgi:hypothetical protein